MRECILTIAGSDPTSGAGIQADLKTASALGCYAACAITCVTAQNTEHFSSSSAVEPAAIAAQIDDVASDMPIRAVKVGMLGSPAVVEAVAAALKKLHAADPDLPIVVDPVLAATTQGDPGDTVQALGRAIVRELAPLATLLTPNLPEATVLANCARVVMRGLEHDVEKPLAAPELADERTVAAWAARILIASGASSVLVKGGHGSEGDTVTDLLFCGQDATGITVHGVAAEDDAFSIDLEIPSLDRYMRTPISYRAQRAEGEFHGTGCALSTAVACNLASGASLPDAVGRAHAYLQTLLTQPLDLGSGSSLIDHFSAGL